MAIRRSDITIDTGDLDKLIRAFRAYPPLFNKTLPPALRKEASPFLRAIRRGVKVRNWAGFTHSVTSRQIPGLDKNQKGIRVKPRNNLAYVFEYGFKNRSNKNVPRPVYEPAWNMFMSRGSVTIQNNVIREGKVQLLKALDRHGIRR